ncbi:hypothetical protein JDW21_18770 [Bacillus subtilis]|uniref:hypothetical protein n=1 Tax=Bacillus subtilis TaxID=1423 RepID=UPI002ED332D9
MLNTRVEVKKMNLTGIVYDYNEKYIWVQTQEDIFKVKADQVSEIKEEVSEAEIFENAILEQGFPCDGFVDGEKEFTFFVKGFTYDISCFLNFENGEFYMDTKHRSFEDRDWNNKKKYKNLNTLIKNVIKWAKK